VVYPTTVGAFAMGIVPVDSNCRSPSEIFVDACLAARSSDSKAVLKNQTVSKQNEWKRMASSTELIADSSLSRFPIDSHNTPPVLHLTDPSTALHSPIQQEVLIPGANTSADIDFFLSHVSGPIQPRFELTEYPLIEELYEDGPEDLLDLHEDPADIPVHKDDISTYAGPFHSEPNEDEPDPFVVESDNSMPPMSGIQREPDHLLVIYAIVAWLHMLSPASRTAWSKQGNRPSVRSTSTSCLCRGYPASCLHHVL